MIRILTASCILLCLIPAAAAASSPVTPVDISVFDEHGAYVYRASGSSLPLYTFDRDRRGTSTCNGPCAAAWPPVLASENKIVGEWDTIKRDDGRFQWAWRGKPVYTFAKDKAGKPTGDGKNGAWRLIPRTPHE